MMRLGCIAALAALIPLSAAAAGPQRIVTLGGSVTEIVYALGEGHRVVADDQSSLYPEAATRLPRVGYYRAVPVEGVLALAPDLVLASEQAGPPDALARLASVGLTVTRVSDAPTVQSLYDRIAQVASALGVAERGAALAQEVRDALAQADALPTSNRSAVLLTNRGAGAQAAGGGTAADLVLRLAGLRNAMAGHAGYKPLNAESLAAYAPEVIVVTSASVAGAAGVAQVQTWPGVAATPAARRGCIVVMDDLLALGVGPRLPLALRTLKETACVADAG
ncbi:MAG: ABC transporter substrate-binding protein [Bordetella sp.]|nr:ABC transporter substrate-binding protein [Bordetella sp.]